MINSFEFFLFLVAIIIFFHILLHFFKDRKYLKIAKSYNDPETVSIKDLKSYPLVSIIIPAWNKGKIFEDLLLSITKLTYPNIKVIVNAGGSEETINIAKSFEKHQNFIFLKQEKGIYLIQGHNKIRALNQCFSYVSEGILFLIDADCYLTDEIMLRMINPIINNGESIVSACARPLKSQETNDIVKYININRFEYINDKFKRHIIGGITGANACLTYDVIKKIGRFRENNLIIEEISRGKDLANHGFSSYFLVDYRSRIFSEYPSSLKEQYQQKRRYVRYKFLYSLQIKDLKKIILIIILFAISIYIVILPLLFFIHLGLFFIGILILLSIYLKKIRRYLAFRAFVNKEFYSKFKIKFFLKILIYIYIEMIFNIKIMFGLIPFILKYRKREIR